MKENPKIPAVMLLADGTVFHGTALGKTGTCSGEIHNRKDGGVIQ